MSTNGIVIVKDGDDIYAKIIAGCNGFAAPELARVLRGSGAKTLQELYDLAHFADFGCKTCLVVMNATEAVYLDGGQGELPQRYWDTYWNLDANPRYRVEAAGHRRGWASDCYEVVSLAEIREAVTS